MTTRRWSQSDLVGATLHWLIDIHWAGQTIRVSTGLVEVVSTELGDLVYEGRIEKCQPTQTLALFGDTPEAGRADVEAVLPVDVPELLAQGHRMEGVRVEIAQWIEGTTYEERLVRLAGRARGIQHGDASEPVRFRVDGTLAEDRGTMIDPAAKVDTTTWPDARESAKGRYYPTVFGTPGVSGSETTSGSPGLVVDSSGGLATVVLISGTEVVAANVTIVNTTDGATFSYPVAHRLDGLGRWVAYVDPSGDAGNGEDDTYFVTWDDGGGVYNLDRSGDMHAAGEVLLYAMMRSTVPMDFGALAAVRPLLRACRIDGYVDQPVSPWDWVRENLLPLLPVSMAQGAQGVYPIVWRPDTVAGRDTVAALDVQEDPTIERIGDLGEEDLEVVNRLTVSFALNAETGQRGASIVVTGAARADSTQLPSLVADLSQIHRAEDGTRRLYADGQVETDILCEPASAAWVAHWRLAAFALPTRPIAFALPSPAWEWLELGDEITATDTTTSLDDRVLVVVGTERGDDGIIAIQCRGWTNPARDLWSAA